MSHEEHNYVIHHDPLFNSLQTMDVQGLIYSVEERWYNQTLISVGDVLARRNPPSQATSPERE